MKPKNAIEIDVKDKADKEGYETMSEISFTDDTLEQQRFADQHQLDASILKELTDMKLKVEEYAKKCTALQKLLKEEKDKREALEKAHNKTQEKLSELEEFKKSINVEAIIQETMRRTYEGMSHQSTAHAANASAGLGGIYMPSSGGQGMKRTGGFG